MRPLALTPALLLAACCVNPFHNTDPRTASFGRPPDPERALRAPIGPAQPAVQTPGGPDGDPGAGFDIRLVRVQPGLHIDSVQSCDVVFSSRPEAIDARSSARYPEDVVQRMSIKCRAPTGEGWADLVITRDRVAALPEVERGRRVRVRLLTPDGGYFDYPIVLLEAVEASAPSAPALSPRPPPVTLPNGFDLRALHEDPALLGSNQSCVVAFADEIDLVGSSDRRRRSYPAGVQNRMTVRCKHAAGEEPADLVFMPSQALAALRVRRGETISVRVISRNGGFVDYPILQYGGP